VIQRLQPPYSLVSRHARGLEVIATRDTATRAVSRHARGLEVPSRVVRKDRKVSRHARGLEG